jgi:hypothetical protein
VRESGEPWDTKAIQRALPPGAVPVAALWMPVAGRAVQRSPDDVVALTREQVRGRLPGAQHLVMALAAADLDPDEEADTLRLIESTDGGVIVVGVAYDLPSAPPRALGQSCPECGSTSAELLGPSDDSVAPEFREQARLYRCLDCGTAWDA